MDIQDTELLTHNSFREVINLISIEKINNGYLVENIGGKRAFPGLDDLFDHLLLIFEGKTQHFHGDSYGKVTIDRTKGEE